MKKDSSKKGEKVQDTSPRMSKKMMHSNSPRTKAQRKRIIEDDWGHVPIR